MVACRSLTLTTFKKKSAPVDLCFSKNGLQHKHGTAKYPTGKSNPFKYNFLLSKLCSWVIFFMKNGKVFKVEWNRFNDSATIIIYAYFFSGFNYFVKYGRYRKFYSSNTIQQYHNQLYQSKKEAGNVMLSLQIHSV